MKILSCNSNLPLADSISKELNLKLVNAEVKRFSDMEVFVEVKENVRGEDMFVIQSTSYPANDNLMELLLSIDALKRSIKLSFAGYEVDCMTNISSPLTFSLTSTKTSISENLLTSAFTSFKLNSFEIESAKGKFELQESIFMNKP